MKKVITIVIILVLAGAGGAVFYAKRGDKEPSVNTLKVSRGAIIDAVGATGTLQAVTTVTVGTQVSGIVQSLENTDFNSIVKKGQVIARLDPSILETQVETARANLTNAQANLERQKVAVADAVTKLARAKELADRQLINKVDLENAEVTLKSAEAQLKSTQSSIVQADAAVNKAKVDLDHTIITAPIDGIVIKRSVDRGQTVNAGMSAPELFIIAADLTKMQVNANIDESDVGRMRPGQDVTFRVDAYPAETFHGSVKQVRLNPTTVQNVVTYSTVIDVPNPDLKLKPGMTANVNIEIARRDNVLRIPNAALRFRPTKEVFEALNQPMPPELTRGNRGGNGVPGLAQNGQPGAGMTPDTATPAAPGASPAAGTATTGQVQARAQANPGSRANGANAAGTQAGGGRTRGAGGQSAQSGGNGQGGPGGPGGRFANMTPEQIQKMRDDRAKRLAAMSPEERASYEERMKQRQANGGGGGGRGGTYGAPGGNAAAGGGRGGNFQRGGSAMGGGSRPAAAASQDASNSKSAATTSATTIDSLFAPIPIVETRGRAWLYVNKQLKMVNLRLGITDSTYTEVLNDTELPADADVVTGVILANASATPQPAPNNANGNPLLPQRGGGRGQAPRRGGG